MKMGISKEKKVQTHGKINALAGLLLLGLFISPVKIHAEQFEMSLRPESKLWLAGDSTLHPFASTATVKILNASFQSSKAGLALAESLSQSDVLAFKVTIPVADLKSGEKGLDKNLYKALKEDKFPNIEFNLTDKHLLPTAVLAGKTKLSSTGVLTIAGKDNTVQIDSEYEFVSGEIHIVGAKQILMSEYGVKPPTILGMIKVKDKVTIYFDLILAPVVAPK